MTISNLTPLANLFQLFAAGLLALAALALFSITVLSAVGVLPWLEIAATFGAAPVPWAGQAAQVGVTILLIVLASFLPASYRVVRLEHSHRRFELDMDDVTRAYRAAHMADRAEVFEMQREFDAVRERYRFLKNQHDFEEMDDLLLTMAAQMSEQSRELASQFSDKRLKRLTESLRHRRQEVDTLLDHSASLRKEAAKLKVISDSVEDDDARAIANLMAAEDDITPKTAVGDGVLRFRKH
jgi:hypothetical protein